MENQNTQPNTPPQPLDPSVVALSQSIAKSETGGKYDAPGGGAYQFTQPTWQVDSKKYLGQSIPLESATPAQQDEVAYNAIKDLGSKGYKPSQVASIWNTGLPDTYEDPNYGTNNTYGSTQKYVKNVEQNYNTFAPKLGIDIKPNTQTTVSDPTTNDWLGGGISKAINWITQNPLESLGIGAGVAGAGALGLAALPEEAGLEGLATGAGAIAKDIGLGTIGAGAENVISSIMGGNKNQTPTGNNNQPTDTTSGILSNLTGDNMTQRNKASTKLANGLMQSLGSTPTGAVYTQKPENQQVVSFGSAMGYSPEVKEGRFDFTNSESQRKKDLKSLDQDATRLTEDETGSIEDWGRKTKESITRDRSILAEDRDGLNNQVDEMVSANTKQHGNSPTLAQFHNIRKGYGHSFRELDALERAGKLPTSLKNKLHRHAYHAAREEVVSKTKNKEAYDKILKVEEKIIKFGEVERRLKGKKVPYNKTLLKDLGKAFGGAAGAYVGNKIGGPVGAALGFLIESRIQSSVEKRYGHNIFQTKGMKKVMEELKRKSPEAYGVIKSGMEKIEKEEKVLALPQGQIRLPDKGVLKGQAELRNNSIPVSQLKSPPPSRTPPKAKKSQKGKVLNRIRKS